MAIRFYLIPLEAVDNGRGPKYLKWRFGTGTLTSPWSLFNYGLQDIALVAANTSTADHNVLAAASDVTTIPANIDNNISAGALNAVRSALEDLWIPGNWVTTANTYRQVLRVVAGLFQFAQRYHGLVDGDPQPLMQGTPNLALTLGDLSLARRQRLQATADSFGYDTSSFTFSSTLRDVLRFLGEAWGAETFHFSSITTL